MGTNSNNYPVSTPTGLAAALFTPVQQRVLGLLFGQPHRRYQSAELIRLAGSGTGATHRVLTRLAEVGLVNVTVEGQQKYYQANAASAVFEELVGFVRKTVGLVGPLRDALAPLLPKLQAAFVYGSVAGGTDRADSDIDVMVIADGFDYPAVFDLLQTAESRLGRRVNPTLQTPDNWRSKRARGDGFTARLESKPRLFIYGSDDDLR